MDTQFKIACIVALCLGLHGFFYALQQPRRRANMPSFSWAWLIAVVLLCFDPLVARVWHIAGSVFMESLHIANVNYSVQEVHVVRVNFELFRFMVPSVVVMIGSWFVDMPRRVMTVLLSVLIGLGLLSNTLAAVPQFFYDRLPFDRSAVDAIMVSPLNLVNIVAITLLLGVVVVALFEKNKSLPVFKPRVQEPRLSMPAELIPKRMRNEVVVRIPEHHQPLESIIGTNAEFTFIDSLMYLWCFSVLSFTLLYVLAVLVLWLGNNFSLLTAFNWDNGVFAYMVPLAAFQTLVIGWLSWYGQTHFVNPYNYFWMVKKFAVFVIVLQCLVALFMLGSGIFDAIIFGFIKLQSVILVILQSIIAFALWHFVGSVDLSQE